MNTQRRVQKLRSCLETSKEYFTMSLTTYDCILNKLYGDLIRSSISDETILIV